MALLLQLIMLENLIHLGNYGIITALLLQLIMLENLIHLGNYGIITATNYVI